MLKKIFLAVVLSSLFLIIISCATLQMEDQDKANALVVKVKYSKSAPDVTSKGLWFTLGAYTYVTLLDQNGTEIIPKYIKPGLCIFPNLAQQRYSLHRGITSQSLGGLDTRTTSGSELFRLAPYEYMIFLKGIKETINLKTSGITFLKLKIHNSNLEIMEPDESEIKSIKALFNAQSVNAMRQ